MPLPEPGNGALEFRQVAGSALRRGIAAIEEGVHQHPHAGPAHQIGQGHHVILVRMHAARRQQPHQVAGAARGLQRRDEIHKLRIGGQRAVSQGGVDTWQVLRHDAAGAQVHVTNLGIAHLAVGQADGTACGLQHAVRATLQQTVPDRRAGQRNGVVRRGRTLAPAVENTKDDGAALVVVVLSAHGWHRTIVFKGLAASGSDKGKPPGVQLAMKPN